MGFPEAFRVYAALGGGVILTQAKATWVIEHTSIRWLGG